MKFHFKIYILTVVHYYFQIIRFSGLIINQEFKEVHVMSVTYNVFSLTVVTKSCYQKFKFCKILF